MEEAHTVNALNNLANALTSDTHNFTNLTMTNANLEEQLKAELSQNKALTYLLRKKIYSVAATKSENQNANKWKCTDKIWENENRIRTEGKRWYLLGYFWNHRYKVEVDHKSWTCRNDRLKKS